MPEKGKERKVLRFQLSHYKTIRFYVILLLLLLLLLKTEG